MYILADDDLYADTAFIWPSRITLLGETVSFSDFVSTLLLLVCSVLSLLLFIKRQQQHATSANIWGLMSFGLFILAQDEFFSYHENFDAWIHEFFGIQMTVWTAQIDTLVLASYAVVAVAVALLWRNREEIRKCTPSWTTFLVSGLLVAVFSMICDALANRPETLRFLIRQDAPALHRIVIEIENLCELGAEVLFLAFFASVLRNISSQAFQRIEQEDLFDSN